MLILNITNINSKLGLNIDKRYLFIFIYLIKLLDEEQINTVTDSKILLNTPIKFNQPFMLKHIHSQFYINIFKSELAEDDSSKEVI